MKFPPEHKFTKLSLLRRGPSSVLQMINKAKNIDELKKNFKEFSDRDRRRITGRTHKTPYLRKSCNSTCDKYTNF